jgi:hypothetical protein
LGVVAVHGRWTAYKEQIYWAKNAHRVEVTDADFRADDRLGVIAAPPSAVSPTRRNQPKKQLRRFEPGIVIGPPSTRVPLARKIFGF